MEAARLCRPRAVGGDWHGGDNASALGWGMNPVIYKYRAICVNSGGKIVGFDFHWTNAHGATNIAEILAKNKSLSLFTVMPGK